MINATEGHVAAAAPTRGATSVQSINTNATTDVPAADRAPERPLTWALARDWTMGLPLPTPLSLRRQLVPLPAGAILESKEVRTILHFSCLA